MLTAHLASVGYTQMDMVEMPGQFTRRGGILDVYSPEADRPVRIEFFGDEIETIRKFDPETQRSQRRLDEAQLLPLTETPVTERLLAAVHARLSRQRVASNRRSGDGWKTRRGGRRQRVSWLGVFRSAWPAPTSTLLDLFPRSRCLWKSRRWCSNQVDRWWNKVEQRHERSGIGSLITPEDIYLRPEVLQAQLASHPGLDLDQLGAVDVLDEDDDAGRD